MEAFGGLVLVASLLAGLIFTIMVALAPLMLYFIKSQATQTNEHLKYTNELLKYNGTLLNSIESQSKAQTELLRTIAANTGTSTALK